MRQLNLNFTGIPIAQTRLWEQLDDEQKRTVIENLARLMTQAVQPDQPKEEAND
jgi:hypothetical protein